MRYFLQYHPMKGYLTRRFSYTAPAPSIVQTNKKTTFIFIRDAPSGMLRGWKAGGGGAGELPVVGVDMRGGAHPHPPTGGHSDTPPPSYRAAGRLARVTGELVTLVTQLSPRGEARVGGGGRLSQYLFSLFFAPFYVLPVDIMLFWFLVCFLSAWPFAPERPGQRIGPGFFSGKKFRRLCTLTPPPLPHPPWPPPHTPAFQKSFASEGFSLFLQCIQMYYNNNSNITTCTLYRWTSTNFYAEYCFVENSH